MSHLPLAAGHRVIQALDDGVLPEHRTYRIVSITKRDVPAGQLVRTANEVRYDIGVFVNGLAVDINGDQPLLK